jgi:DNA-binding NarL/FixJ family response regulator
MITHLFVLASLPGTLARMKSYLRAKKQVSVSGFSMDPADAIKYMSEKPYHILLIDDAFFRREDIFYLMERLCISRASEKTIIYTGSNDAQYITQLIKLGITAIVHKRSGKDNLIDAIKLVSLRASYIDSYFNFRLFKDNFGVYPPAGEGPFTEEQDLSISLN